MIPTTTMGANMTGWGWRLSGTSVINQKTRTLPPTHQKLTMLTYGAGLQNKVIASHAQNIVRDIGSGDIGILSPLAYPRHSTPIRYSTSKICDSASTQCARR